jgi:hypothetical protein
VAISTLTAFDKSAVPLEGILKFAGTAIWQAGREPDLYYFFGQVST